MVTEFDANRKLICDFLLVINTNPPTEGFTWDDLRKILPGCQRKAKKVDGVVETLPKISMHLSRAHESYRQMTDRQTDLQRHIATFAKKCYRAACDPDIAHFLFIIAVACLSLLNVTAYSRVVSLAVSMYYAYCTA